MKARNYILFLLVALTVGACTLRIYEPAQDSEEFAAARAWPRFKWKQLEQVENTRLTTAPTYAEPAKPTRPETFDYYIDGTGGNDSNAGTSRAAAFASTSPMNTLISTWAGVDTVDILFLGGTYSGYIRAAGTLASYTVFRVWTQGLVTIDRDSSQVGDDSAFSVGGTNNELQVIGPITIVDVYNNGFSTFEATKGYIWDADISDCDDGLSAHGSSTLYAINCNVYDCNKYAIAHVATATTYHWRVTATGKSGAVGGHTTTTSGTTAYFYDCVFLPPAGSSSEPPEMFSTTTFENCFMGMDTMSGSWTTYMTSNYCTFDQCYFNMAITHYLDTEVRNSWGQFTVRPRGPITDSLTIKNCTFSGAYASESGRFLNYNFISAPSDVGGVIVFQDNILTGYTTAFYASSTSAGDHADSAYVFRHNLLYNNTTDYTNISTAATDITTDPGLYDATPAGRYAYQYTYSETGGGVNAGYNGGDVGIGRTNDLYYTYAAEMDRNGEMKLVREEASGGGQTYTAGAGLALSSNQFSLDINSLDSVGVADGDSFAIYDATDGSIKRSGTDNIEATASMGLRAVSGDIRLGMPGGNYNNPLTQVRQINMDGFDLMFIDTTSSPASLIISDDYNDNIASWLGLLTLKGDAGSKPSIVIAPEFGGTTGDTEIAGEIEILGNSAGFGTRKSQIIGYGIGARSSLSFWTNNGDGTPVQAVDIRYDGNVGIGTASITAPSQPLHVAGNARIEGALYDSGNSAGTSGQVLSSTGTGTDWVDAGGIGTDDQTVDTFSLSGTTLTLALEGDNEAPYTVDLSSIDTDTQLSNEQVQDIVGAMLTGNTETGITVTYQDADGTIDFEVTAGGSMSSWTWGDGTSTTAITDGETVQVVGSSNGIDATLSGNNITVDLDFSELSSAVGITSSDDFIAYNSGTGTEKRYSQGEVEEKFEDHFGNNVITAGTGIGVSYSDAAGTITISNTASGMSSWTWGGDATTTTITDGETVRVQGSSGLDATLSANTVTVSLDVLELSTLTLGTVSSLDYLLLYDNSAAGPVKASPLNFVVPEIETSGPIILNGVSAEPTGGEGGIFYDTDDDRIKLETAAGYQIIPIQADMPAKYSGFTEYVASTSVSPVAGAVLFADSQEGATEITLTINPTNLTTGDRIIVVLNTDATYGGVIATSGAQVFYGIDIDGTTATLSFGTNQDAILYLIYDGTNFFVIDHAY